MPLRRGSFQLMRLFGIRIGVGVSWFVVLFLYIFYFTPYFHSVLGGSRTMAYVVTVASVLSFFASIIVHELGHALVARRQGLEVVGIELWMLGGVTRTAGTVDTPGPAFRIAAAGPAATLAIVVAALVAGIAITPAHRFVNIASGGGGHATAVTLWLSWLATLNALVLVVNLVPAVPLDGGQMAHAIVWKLTGDRNRATSLTGRLGQAVALVAAAAGVVILVRGDSLGFWLLLIALFVHQGAGAIVAQGSVGARIAATTVADIMNRRPITLSPETTVLDAGERYFSEIGTAWLAVVEPDRRLLGVVTRPRVESELAAGRPALTVAEALEDEPPSVRIDEHAPLEALLRSETMRRLGGMVAVDAHGLLSGVVTHAEVRDAVGGASR